MGYILDPLGNKEKELRFIYLKPSKMEKSIIEGTHPHFCQSMFCLSQLVFDIDMDYGIWFSYITYMHMKINLHICGIWDPRGYEHSRMNRVY